MNTKTISERVYQQNQSWYFERTVLIGGEKLKVEIRRNAYDDQSYGRVMKWDGNEWKQVVHSPIQLLQCRHISYVTSGVVASHFEKDFGQLFNEAAKIIL
jgi:hypothetical protein